METGTRGKCSPPLPVKRTRSEHPRGRPHRRSPLWRVTSSQHPDHSSHHHGPWRAVIAMIRSASGRRRASPSRSELGASMLACSRIQHVGRVRLGAGSQPHHHLRRMPGHQAGDPECRGRRSHIAASAQVVWGQPQLVDPIQGTTARILRGALARRGRDGLRPGSGGTAHQVAVLGETVRAQSLRRLGSRRPGHSQSRRSLHGRGHPRQRRADHLGQDQDDVILVPLTTAKRKLPG